MILILKYHAFFKSPIRVRYLAATLKYILILTVGVEQILRLVSRLLVGQVVVFFLHRRAQDASLLVTARNMPLHQIGQKFITLDKGSNAP